MKKIIIYNNKKLKIYFDTYQNGRIFMGLVEKNGDLFCDITKNLPQEECQNDEAFIDTNNMPDGLYETLIRDGVISKRPESFASSGFSDYPKHKILLPITSNNSLKESNIVSRKKIVKEVIISLRKKGLFNEDKLKSKKTLKEDIQIGLERYPEFTDAVKEISNTTIQAISQKAKTITSEMPYKAQFLLEEVIKNLEERV